MRTLTNLLSLAALTATLYACAPGSADFEPIAEYPEAPRGDQVDDYFGVAVTDPYRWLEDLESDETAAWVAAQNAISIPYLEAIPQREQIKQSLTELWNYERYGLPRKEGDRYFFRRNDGLQDQDVLYVADALDAEPRVLIDPNGFREDATISLSSYLPSPDGSLLAYSTSDGGSDWRTWKVRDVDSGEDLEGELTHIKFTIASWARDGSGFYYSRYPEGPDGKGDGTKTVSVYFHTVGTEQSEDVHIYSVPGETRRNPYAQVTEDGRYLVLRIHEGSLTNAVYYRSLVTPEAPVVPLLDEWDARYDFLGNEGPVFYFQTNGDAPRERVIAIDVTRPDRDHWREVIAQSEDTLENASLVGGHLVALYLHDASSRAKVFGTDGELSHDVELPGLGSVSGFRGSETDPETFFSFTSFTSPARIFRYLVDVGESTLFRAPEVAVDLDAYQTEQVFFESKDGTRIPMFLVHRSDLVRDGQNPTLLYGYGGFNVSLTPGFSVQSRLAWLEMGGVLAIPNLRGGGEYGREWHLAGTKEQQAERLRRLHRRSRMADRRGLHVDSERIAIQGGSNGGLLVGATLNQRPDLFGAVPFRRSASSTCCDITCRVPMHVIGRPTTD